ncbi:DUF421 domain-containing protein [Chryseobacterium balustinum]|uniref:Uncharacterized membrane protein YcaP, DUF421 family n=1 Tax=Chryseobacterium balustinum TaxID=246 RepID=A0ABY1L6L1_9FLAO|nr:YetF domain-containing protein [Chryseobacterium balustinum]AZB29062.1 DUF421 domain-containing protein [Chryseobacterium balustinum]SKB59789.1 Uncharacterized membrane protein YcaP, DUF421 family [Chryseobacterium balustinum]
MFLATFLNFNWKELFLGTEDWGFLLEIVLRTIIMFLTIIVSLRVLGKRGVKQLSIFELVVIIGLGSAAGDPMFYKEVGIVSSMLVFLVIIILYSSITALIGRFKKIENLFEGKAICLIEQGVFAIDNFKKENLGSDEFFAELRVKGISHLGQVELAIEEVSGEISVFFNEDQKVKYGLPIMLNSLDNPIQNIQIPGYYSCTFCGFTELKEEGNAGSCNNCGKKNWVEASNKIRVT